MSCQDIQQKLSTFADSELAEDQQRELLLHLEQCASCRRVLEEQRSLNWLLKNRPEPPLPEQYLDTFYEQLFEKLEQLVSPVDPELEGEEYPLLERLGASETGELFLTRTTTTEDDVPPRPLVLKRLSPRYAENSEYLLAFIRSAQVISQLSHANICPIVKAGTDSKGTYLVRGYIAGMDLRSLIKRHALQRRLIPQPVTLEVIRAISLGLEHAHPEIIHGNLTPSTVLLGFAGEVRLINFGMGPYWAQQLAAGRSVPQEQARYLAPEHLTGGPIDQRTDVFSLALIMYELLTGKQVFPEGLDHQRLKQLTAESIPPPSSVRPALASILDQLVMQGLELDPAERYASVQEVREELDEILADETNVGMDLVTLMTRTFANEIGAEEQRAVLVLSGAIPELEPLSASQPEAAPAEPALPPAHPLTLPPPSVAPSIPPVHEERGSGRHWMGIAAVLILVGAGGILFALMPSNSPLDSENTVAVRSSEPAGGGRAGERPATAPAASASTEPTPVAAPAKPTPVAAPAKPLPEPAATTPDTATDTAAEASSQSMTDQDTGDDADDAPEAVQGRSELKPPSAATKAPKPRAHRARRRRIKHHRRRHRPRSRPRPSRPRQRAKPKPRSQPASPSVVQPKPEPAPRPQEKASTGYLKVVSATPVDVVVDGWKTTTVGGKLHMKLSTGTHRVKVIFKESGQSFDRTIVIKAGKTKVLRLVRGR